MRKPALAGLLACAIIIGGQSSPVSAEAPDPFAFESRTSTFSRLALEELAAPVAARPEEIRYVVAVNDSLSSIAAAHATTWPRLYSKNPHIADPDVIVPGMELVIPAADEVLAERPLPVPPPRHAIEPAAAQPVNRTTSIAIARQAPEAPAPKPAAPAATAGNTYARGYCTWYAKHRRPDLPNNLGNADTWLPRARAQGLPTGSAPRAGAIGQRGMHVVYVERVNSDGTVTISEMNFKGWGIVSWRTVPASDFMYIY